MPSTILNLIPAGRSGARGDFGLFGMCERARPYDGRLNIESSPGKGAPITAWLPAH